MSSTCSKFQEICTIFTKLKIVCYERAQKNRSLLRKIVATNNCLLHIKFIGRIKCMQKYRKLLVD